MPTVLVTGASRGIGQATAVRLAGRGWYVLGGVRREQDASALRSLDERILPIPLDVTEPADVAGLEAVVPDRLDAVVNNAGIVVGGPIEAVPVADLRRQLETNVVGPLAVTQALLPRLRRSGGRVVFISSLSGRIPMPFTGAYCASKSALEALADALRMELRPWRLPVVIIEPAQTDTDLWRRADQTFEDAVAGLTSEQRVLYARHIEGQRRAIPRSQRMASPAEAVAACIEEALTHRRPKPRYVVGTMPKLMALATRVMPPRARDAAIAASMGVPSRP